MHSLLILKSLIHFAPMCPEADLLKEVPLFNLLDDQERAALAGQLELVRFAAGQVIFNYGDPGDSIYVVSEGELEVFCKNDTGERMVLEVPTRGDFVGETFLIGIRYPQCLGHGHHGCIGLPARS